MRWNSVSWDTEDIFELEPLDVSCSSLAFDDDLHPEDAFVAGVLGGLGGDLVDAAKARAQAALDDAEARGDELSALQALSSVARRRLGLGPARQPWRPT